jgi:uracil-DNA glycosylase
MLYNRGMKTVSAAAIFRFARHLQETAVPDDVNNFYAARRTNLQRHNLQCYLKQMTLLHPDTLLVGEAPGHNGCARTGVPFSSERLLREGVLGGKLYGVQNGYRVRSGSAVHEQSAAAMWEVLAERNRIPLIWNAYPFHPHLKGDPFSNRKPRASELKVGMEFLTELIGMFGIKKVIAVGNAAEAVLEKMGIDHQKVRHPAHGGRRAFKEGIRKLLKGA